MNDSDNDRAEMALCLVMVLYAVMIVAMVDGWFADVIKQSLIVWLPPSVVMLAYRLWLIPVSDAGALCAGRE